MKKPSILFDVDKVLGIISDALYAADDDTADSGVIYFLESGHQ